MVDSINNSDCSVPACESSLEALQASLDYVNKTVLDASVLDASVSVLDKTVVDENVYKNREKSRDKSKDKNSSVLSSSRGSSSRGSSSSSSSSSSTTTTTTTTTTRPATKPLKREALGYFSWSILHSIAANMPEKPAKNERKAAAQLINGIATLYPCNDCREDFQQSVKVRKGERTDMTKQT
jgi:hypothetical protein